MISEVQTVVSTPFTAKLCHISMSYAWYDIKCHIITNEAYDFEIWHESMWSILVSRRPSWLQQSHPFVGFWLFFFKIIEKCVEILSLYKCWKSVVFSAEMVMKSGHRRNHLSAILWCFWASQALYKILEPTLQTQLDNFWTTLLSPPGRGYTKIEIFSDNFFHH